MLAIKGIVLVTICTNYVSAEYKIHSDGWKPVSREKINNQLRRESQQNLALSKQQLQSETNSDTGIRAQAPQRPPQMKIQSKKLSNKFNSRYETDEHTENKFDSIESSRKPKKIDYSNSKNNLDTFTGTKLKSKDEIADDTVEAASVIAEKKIGYAVTEDTEDVQDTNQYNFNSVYNYQLTPTEIQNSNTTLYNILSKYNINTNDVLKNYDLSRANFNNPVANFNNPAANFNNPAAKFQRFWYPYRDRYNSLNHLPVDPLLAVFLSNYGFYIPNMYGIKSNYNNLYGYLASNNIHNNQPFGLYKVFSDTDSWN